MRWELKPGIVIKEFMSYLKSAGVSKVDKSLWARFIGGAKKGK